MNQVSSLKEQAAKVFGQLDNSGSGKINRSEEKSIRDHTHLSIPLPHHESYNLTKPHKPSGIETSYSDSYLQLATDPDKKFSELSPDNIKDKSRFHLQNDVRERIYHFENENHMFGGFTEKKVETRTQIRSRRIDHTHDSKPTRLTKALNEERTTNGSLDFKTWSRNFFAGAIAGAVSRTCTAPFERLKILYQVNYACASASPPSISTGLSGIYSMDGPRGFFKGNLTNILKATPESAIRFAIFEHMKIEMINSQGLKPHEHLSPLDHFTAGAVAGLVANFFVYPLDVLKVRISAAPKGMYLGLFDAFTKIRENEGRIRPFYRGLSASLGTAMPSTGLSFMTYEVLKKFLLKDSHRGGDSHVLKAGIGGLSALITSSILYPCSTVCSRIIMQGMKPEIPESDRKLLNVIRNIWKEEGARGFYKGYRPAITKIILGVGISFGTFEFMKSQLLVH